MDYVELNIPIENAEQGEILMALLEDYPFDSFTTEGGLLKAYIPQMQLVDCKDQVDQTIAPFKGARYIQIETQNWNAQWESNFSPVEVERKVYIRAPFHEPNPEFEMEVVIMPKMSFGTGHHDTTHLMSERIGYIDVANKRGLDMGSGTGVLAIIAAKLGAEHLDAVDIDDWATINCQENIEQNGVAEKITPILGDASSIDGRHYDFILANINRNILLRDMPLYNQTLAKGGDLLISGFLKEDIAPLKVRANELGFNVVDHFSRNEWVVMHLQK